MDDNYDYGFDDGYRQGYDDGYKAGYDQGKQDGLDEIYEFRELYGYDPPVASAWGRF